MWEAISHTDKDIQHLFVTQMEQLFHWETDRSEELAFIERLLPYMKDTLNGTSISFKMIKYKPLAIHFQQILKKTIGRRLRNYVENIISSGNYQENAILRMDPTIFTFSLTEKPTEDGKIIPLYALLDDTGGEKKVDVKACFYVFDGKDN